MARSVSAQAGPRSKKAPAKKKAAGTRTSGRASAAAARAPRTAEPEQAHVVIRSASFHFPEDGISTLVLTQREKPHRVFLMRERKRIGSRYVRLAGPSEPPSAIATAAAQKALDRAGIDPATLDMVVTAGVTPPDFDLWSMPAKVAQNIGATHAECFGFGEAACASPFAALRCLVPMMRAPGGPERVLIAAGCVTPGGHFFEPSTIYGDGGGAMILERSTGGRGLRVVRADYYTNCRWVDTFGAVAGVSKLKAEGKLEPSDWTVRIKRPEEMDQLIDDTGARGSAFVRKTLTRAGWTPQDLRWLIGDNVAAIIPIDMAAVLGVPEDRILVENCTRYGHAWVADVFVNLATILEDHPPVHGDRLACVGIGQGEHWGVALLEAHMEDA